MSAPAIEHCLSVLRNLPDIKWLLDKACKIEMNDGQTMMTVHFAKHCAVAREALTDKRSDMYRALLKHDLDVLVVVQGDT